MNRREFWYERAQGAVVEIPLVTSSKLGLEYIPKGSLQKKKNIFFVTNVTLALTPPPKCDEKPSAFFGQKWPFQEVKIFYFNHAIICQSLQSIFENFLPKILLSQPETANSPPFRA